MVPPATRGVDDEAVSLTGAYEACAPSGRKRLEAGKLPGLHAAFQARLHDFACAGNAPDRVRVRFAFDRLARLDYSRLQHAQVPPAAAGAANALR